MRFVRVLSAMVWVGGSLGLAPLFGSVGVTLLATALIPFGT